MSRKALVLHSGGLDSTVCLLMALEQGREVISLGIDYGQRHIIELEYALAQCRQLNVPRRVLRVEWDKPVRSIPEGRLIEEIRNNVSPAFLPGRNAVFLALACAEAAGLSMEEVWIGVNAIDFSGYPDCRPEFVEAFRQMIKEAIPNGPGIVTPLISMSKSQIAQEAYRLGLRKGDTWCCYQPIVTSRGVEACGECDACVLHEYAWAGVVVTNNTEGGLLTFRGAHIGE
ncbi:MAG: 7-cyano-7-deazaguanine synthase QueC [Anaerolineae bacterium]